MSLRQKVIDQLAALGLSPQKSLGQNFLIGESVIHKIISQVEKVNAPAVIEVGPGLGALTRPLSKLQNELSLVELDRGFCEFWRGEEFKVYETDALKWNWADEVKVENTHLVSNLPYQISSSLVILVSEEVPKISHMTLMFQKEVAQRLVAQEGQKSYGLLSVIAQAHWEMSLVLEAAPNEFYPPPKIASRVLHFKRKPAALGAEFTHFVKAGFAQRRKKLVKNLSAFAGAQETFREMGLDESLRAEALSVDEWIQLFRLVVHGN